MAMIGFRQASRCEDATIATATAAWLERALFCTGVLGLLYCGWQYAQMQSARRAAEAIVPVQIQQWQTGFGETSPEAGLTAVPGGSAGRPVVVGRVEIAAIGLVTPLLDGDDAMSLTEGAGHIPGTAFPGGLGTVGIAGHRDTHFRLLAKVQPGMEIRLVSREGVYRYRVTSSEVVAPEQVSVLAIGQVPGLALVTCYPFQFLGHAPKRFIVHADLVSAAAEDAAGR